MSAPSLMNKTRHIRFILYLNEEEKQRLKTLAEESGENMGELIRRLLILEERKRKE